MGKDSKIKNFWRWIGPNPVWDFLKWVGGSSMVTALGKFVIAEYHKSPVDWALLASFFLIGALLVFVGLWFEHNESNNDERGIETETKTQPTQEQEGMIPGIPTISSLLGQNPVIDFDAQKFFASAHYSPVTAEFEKNIKIIAQKCSPNDKEIFYARFIGVGLATFHYEQTWLLIFGSQLKAIEEMNSRGTVPVSDLKNHYNKAVVEYPQTYSNYSFEQWYAFMKGRMLIADYPSKMVELSWMGRDFLKYLAHTARDINKEKN